MRTVYMQIPGLRKIKPTFCSFSFVPSSAIRWCRTHSFLAGGWGCTNSTGSARGDAAASCTRSASASASAARTSSTVTTWNADLGSTSSAEGGVGSGDGERERRRWWWCVRMRRFWGAGRVSHEYAVWGVGVGVDGVSEGEGGGGGCVSAIVDVVGGVVVVEGVVVLRCRESPVAQSNTILCSHRPKA